MSDDIQDVVKKAKQFLFARQQAYQTVFAGDRVAEDVLKDLRALCRADESCFHPDARVHAVNEGRREVIIRIGHHVNLSPEELWQLYQGDG